MADPILSSSCTCLSWPETFILLLCSESKQAALVKKVGVEMETAIFRHPDFRNATTLLLVEPSTPFRACDHLFLLFEATLARRSARDVLAIFDMLGLLGRVLATESVPEGVLRFGIEIGGIDTRAARQAIGNLDDAPRLPRVGVGVGENVVDLLERSLLRFRVQEVHHEDVNEISRCKDRVCVKTNS